MRVELKTASGKRVVWDGNSPEDACQSYATHSGETVIAWRHSQSTNIIMPCPERNLNHVIKEPGSPGFHRPRIGATS